MGQCMALWCAVLGLVIISVVFLVVYLRKLCGIGDILCHSIPLLSLIVVPCDGYMIKKDVDTDVLSILHQL